jgi:preprotein translocase SecE subunit
MDKNNSPLARAGSADELAETDVDLAEESDEVGAQELALSPVDAESTDLSVDDSGIASRTIARPSTGLTVPAWANSNPITRYFYECYIELRKTTWPSNNEAWTMTWIVIGMSIGVAILLGAADYALNYLITWVLNLPK